MDTATQQLIGTIVSTLGTSGVLVIAANGLIKWLSGFSHRERVKNTNLNARAEKADIKRREAEEHVSILKRQLLEAGLKPLEREDVID
jgi:hypothetical protein